jgi:hypothetical protein
MMDVLFVYTTAKEQEITKTGKGRQAAMPRHFVAAAPLLIWQAG